MTRRRIVSLAALLCLLAVGLMSLSAPSRASHDNGRGTAWGPCLCGSPGWSSYGVSIALGRSGFNPRLLEVLALHSELGDPDHP